jgi:hypothetical protein
MDNTRDRARAQSPHTGLKIERGAQTIRGSNSRHAPENIIRRTFDQILFQPTKTAGTAAKSIAAVFFNKPSTLSNLWDALFRSAPTYKMRSHIIDRIQ